MLGLHNFSKPKPAHERCNRRALADERDEDDPEGQQEESVTMGKSRAVHDSQRQSEGGGKRDYATDAEE